MMVGTVEVMGVLAIVCVLGVLLAIVDAPPRNPARYSGRIYDPQRPVLRRAGAIDLGGRRCPFCDALTFGWSSRCGKCGQVLTNTKPVIRTESTRRNSLVPHTTPPPGSEVSPQLSPRTRPSPRSGGGAT